MRNAIRTRNSYTNQISAVKDLIAFRYRYEISNMLQLTTWLGLEKRALGTVYNVDSNRDGKTIFFVPLLGKEVCETRTVEHTALVLCGRFKSWGLWFGYYNH